MAGDRSPNRDRSRRRETRENPDQNRRDRNRERFEEKSRNDRSKRRDRSRSRSRNRDDDNRPRKSKHESREHNHRARDRDDHSRKFDFSNSNVKKEPSPEWGKRVPKEEKDSKNAGDKEKPNFALSGKLTEDRNAINGVVIKYSEPGDARKPKRRWRLYPYKGEKELPIIHIHRQSAYLMGRDRTVADIPLDHPSCSKQHAALQFRLVPFKREDGSTGKCVKPYLIDLESANGTLVNDVKLEARRYHELFERDVLKFGFSSREYVLLHENSKDEAMDDDFIAPNET
ncbi:smad nuclear-interacting protein 1 [Diachasma alloeum]|uniref:smad nuclear-interacting protein 1 n=1 Tax=Diachasma alloeum TaxID=454923 RepID=UPI0007382C37|nr:smad nuclear-interacting protein 1 [Diachasma alloeum]